MLNGLARFTAPVKCDCNTPALQISGDGELRATPEMRETLRIFPHAIALARTDQTAGAVILVARHRILPHAPDGRSRLAARSKSMGEVLQGITEAVGVICRAIPPGLSAIIRETLEADPIPQDAAHDRHVDRPELR